MTLTAIHAEVGQTHTLFPLLPPPDEQRRLGQRSTPGSLKSGQRFAWQGAEWLIVRPDNPPHIMAARLPVRRDSTVETFTTDTIHREGERMTARSIDSQITTDALLDLRSLTTAYRRVVVRDIERNPDFQILDNRPLPKGYLSVRSASPHALRALVGEYRRMALTALEYLMPDALITKISRCARNLRLEYPTIDQAIAIINGQRLTLDDCHERHLWVEPGWNGEVGVLIAESESGYRFYEILGSRRGSKKAANRRDWICDCETLTEAVDTAALLRASFESLDKGIRQSGETPSSAMQK